jgi:hypothetical protein
MEGGMPISLRNLSPLESTALIQVKISARLDARLRSAANRLIHFGIVDETSTGLKLTPLGEEYCKVEADRRGIGRMDRGL